jgi:hypothetical protein
MANPSDKYRQNAVLEGGKSGSSGSSALQTAANVGGPAALTFAGGTGAALLNMRKADAEERAAREAEAEMKREKRGVEKTPSDRAREDAREMRMMELNDKASRAASRDMGMKKGGKVSSASSRADGIAQRGKTRGKMIMCGGGKV